MPKYKAGHPQEVGLRRLYHVGQIRGPTTPKSIKPVSNPARGRMMMCRDRAAEHAMYADGVSSRVQSAGPCAEEG